MISNLSSIHNTVSRQAGSLGKSAAVHTLHNIKPMPLSKETPGNLVICSAAPWMVKHLPSRAQVTSTLSLVWCLLPWAKKSCPLTEKLQRCCSCQLCSSTSDLESAVQIPTALHLDATRSRETPYTVFWEAEMPHSPLVLWEAQEGSHTHMRPERLTLSIKLPSTQEETTSDLQRGQAARISACSHQLRSGRSDHLEAQVRTTLPSHTHSYGSWVSTAAHFLTARETGLFIFKNICNSWGWAILRLPHSKSKAFSFYLKCEEKSGTIWMLTDGTDVEQTWWRGWTPRRTGRCQPGWGVKWKQWLSACFANPRMCTTGEHAKSGQVLSVCYTIPCLISN